MMDKAKNASMFDHPGMIGELREMVLSDLVRPLLNMRYSAGTGKITDHEGTLSSQIDVCVCSTLLLPPFFISAQERLGLYPIESVLTCFEVKSNLTLSGIRDAYTKFQGIENSLKFSPAIHTENDHPLPHRFAKPEHSLFAFGIDKKNYKISSILEMYKKIDPCWNDKPLISSFCVAGKGCLIHTTKGWLHMAYDAQNTFHEEIIFYLCATIQALPFKEQSRYIPRIGYYLTEPSKSSRFEDGKALKESWKNVRWVISNTNID